ncbi:hypothetical protein JCM3766R1_001213 [Sporobolomyces carnicolor]
MFSQHELHNPRVVLPRGPRTASQYAHTVNPLTSNRHGHVARLYSIVTHLLSLAPSPETSTRLVRAWRALAACKEVHVGVLWRTGTAVIERADGRDDDGDATGHAKADWLKFVQEGKLEKVDKFHEYILALVAAGQSQFGLDELESYLDNQPYHDSIALNALSGQLSLLLAQPGPSLDPPRHDRSCSSTTSSDSDDGDVGSHARSRPSLNDRRDPKRAKNFVESSRDDEISRFLGTIARHSPALFSKAKERFKRAAQLEEQAHKDTDPGLAASDGEAARWRDLIERSEKLASRDGSPL